LLGWSVCPVSCAGARHQFKAVLSLTKPGGFDYSKLIKFNLFDINGTGIQNIEQLLNLGIGRHTVRGPNGVGKSVSLALVKHQMGQHAYLLPASADLYLGIETRGFSSGQRTLAYLRTIFASPDLPKIILLDEWDAHLDNEFRDKVDQEIENISRSRVVIEVRHGDSVT
jgi:Fe-S cluster assembly ATPase SufC